MTETTTPFSDSAEVEWDTRIRIDQVAERVPMRGEHAGHVPVQHNFLGGARIALRQQRLAHSL